MTDKTRVQRFRGFDVPVVTFANTTTRHLKCRSVLGVKTLTDDELAARGLPEDGPRECLELLVVISEETADA